MKIIRNKYKCTKCGHTTVQEHAKRCAMCGEPVVEIINGEEVIQKSLKQIGLYLEGLLTIPFFIALAHVGTHFWAAMGSMALLMALMVVIIPSVTGLIPPRRKARRRRAK